MVYYASNWRPTHEPDGYGVFRESGGMFGEGVYFVNDFNEASMFAGQKLDDIEGINEDNTDGINNFIYDNGYVTEAFLNIRDEERIFNMDSEGEGMKYYVAHPYEIKSATENNGEFSRENDDIRFSISVKTQLQCMVFPEATIKEHTLHSAAGKNRQDRGMLLYLDLLKEVLYGKDTNSSETSNASGVNFSVTPAQDAEYMSAVESGDMEKAERAGYTAVGYHGTIGGGKEVLS